MFRRIEEHLLESKRRRDWRVPFVVFWWLYASPIDVFAAMVRDSELARGVPIERLDEFDRLAREAMAELASSPFTRRNARVLVEQVRDMLSVAHERPKLCREIQFAPSQLHRAMDQIQDAKYGKENEQERVANWRTDMAAAARSMLPEPRMRACLVAESRLREMQRQAEEHSRSKRSRKE